MLVSSPPFSTETWMRPSSGILSGSRPFHVSRRTAGCEPMSLWALDSKRRRRMLASAFLMKGCVGIGGLYRLINVALQRLHVRHLEPWNSDGLALLTIQVIYDNQLFVLSSGPFYCCIFRSSAPPPPQSKIPEVHEQQKCGPTRMLFKGQIGALVASTASERNNIVRCCLSTH